MNFYDEIANLTATSGSNPDARFDATIRMAIRSAAIQGNTKAILNLKECKVLTKENIAVLSTLINEGFSIEVKLNLSTYEYPTIEITIGWVAIKEVK